jgi:hypothetical protein
VSIEPDTVAAWARFCVGLVEFADSVNYEVLKTFLHYHIDDNPKTDFNIRQIMKALVMSDIAEYYTGSVEENKTEITMVERYFARAMNLRMQILRKILRRRMRKFQN